MGLAFLPFMGGAGGTKSKSTSKIVHDSAIEIIQTTSNSCRAAAGQSQIVTISGNKGNVDVGGIELSQKVKASATCLMDVEKQANIKQKISDVIAQEAHSKGAAGLSWMGRTESETSSNVLRKFNAKYNQSEVNNAIATTTQRFVADIVDNEGDISVGGLTSHQIADTVAESILKTRSFADVIQETTTQIDQSATSEDTFLGLGGGAGMWLIIFVVIAAIIGYFVLTSQQGMQQGMDQYGDGYGSSYGDSYGSSYGSQYGSSYNDGYGSQY